MASRLRVWLRRAITHETGRWVALAGSVGVICGIAGFVLQAGADSLGWLLLQRLCGMPPLIAAGHASITESTHAQIAWPIVLLVLGAGGAASGWLATRFAIAAKGGGTSHAIDAYHRQRGSIPLSVPLTKIVASVLTLGSGGSAGREGPIALVGAGFASWFAQRLHLTTRDRRILLVAGIAGGIAAVFRAPLAASLFACEVLYRGVDLETEALIPAFIAAIIAYCVSGQLDGLWCSATGWFTPYGSTLFAPPPGMAFGFTDWPQLIGCTAIVVGVVATARLFISVTERVSRLAEASRRPVWVSAAIGAIAAGLVAIAFVGVGQWFVPDRMADILPSTLGSGYGVIHWCLHGGMKDATWAVSLALLAIALGKALTTAATVGSGGSGGMFGPAIAIGGCLGAAIGTAMEGLPIAPPPAAALLLGMAGLLAATHRTPVAAMLMVAEISGSYLLLIPSMWVVGLSFLLMRGRSILVGQVEHLHESPAHRSHLFSDVFATAKVGDLIAEAPRWTPVPTTALLGQCRQVLLDADQAVLPVVNADGRLIGIITPEDVRALGRDPMLDHLVLASDIASGAASALTVHDSLARAMRRMIDQRLDGLPAIDGQRRPIAVVSRRMLLDHYQRALDRMRSDQRAEGYEEPESSPRSQTNP